MNRHELSKEKVREAVDNGFAVFGVAGRYVAIAEGDRAPYLLIQTMTGYEWQRTTGRFGAQEPDFFDSLFDK